ncbi:ribosome silencing factor [Deinococcus arenicola]|uniref:ribosome silencing factor n=1 Tax=Deinococcus arenicola TaxID=2994950 RepID=UPI002952AFBE|nr:ribosome silencing factor [Deinococcus sp. ZS9-10]
MTLNTENSQNAPTRASRREDDQRQLRAIVEATRERRAEDVRVLDLSDVSSTLEYFVICTATAGLQLNAIQENVRIKAMEAGLARPSVEGPSERWLLLSFSGSIVVHIMTKEAREYYDLEGLWSDARALDFPESDD